METKTCKYCFSEIDNRATKCKHCGEFLGSGRKIINLGSLVISLTITILSLVLLLAKDYFQLLFARPEIEIVADEKFEFAPRIKYNKYDIPKNYSAEFTVLINDLKINNIGSKKATVKSGRVSIGDGENEILSGRLILDSNEIDDITHIEQKRITLETFNPNYVKQTFPSDTSILEGILPFFLDTTYIQRINIELVYTSPRGTKEYISTLEATKILIKDRVK